MNSKGQLGAEFVFIFWRLGLVALVAFFISAIVWSHYAQHIDVRPAEATALSERLLSCLNFPDLRISKGELVSCLGISDTEEGEFLVKVSAMDEAVVIGNPVLEDYCKIAEKMEKPPHCLNESFLALSEGKPVRLSTFIAIRKIEKNV